MSVMRRVAFALFTLLGSEARALASDPFQVVQYHLPRTAVSAHVALTLEGCDAVPHVSGELSLVATGAADPSSYSLTAGQLQSARVKRALQVTLQKNGTIASVDSEVEDRSAAILGNVVKFAASLISLVPFRANALGEPSNTSVCTDAAWSALQRVQAIDAALLSLRRKAVPTVGKEVTEQTASVTALAAERASLRVGVLHVELDTPLQMSDTSGWLATSQVDTAALQKAWLKQGDLPMQVSWIVALPAGASLPAPDAQPASACRTRLSDPKVDGKAICFSRPLVVPITAKLVLQGCDADRSCPEDASASVPMAQWGTLQLLDLHAGFGSKKSLALTLDEFGRVTSMNWTSEARAETVTAGLAGVADQVSTAVAANSTLARQKREIDELTTQQTLNRIRACREILAAGGSACPAEATAAATQ